MPAALHAPASAANDNDLALMQWIDELFTAWPFLGSRRMAAMLQAEGQAEYSVLQSVPEQHQFGAVPGHNFQAVRPLRPENGIVSENESCLTHEPEQRDYASPPALVFPLEPQSCRRPHGAQHRDQGCGVDPRHDPNRRSADHNLKSPPQSVSPWTEQLSARSRTQMPCRFHRPRLPHAAHPAAT
jgi:hypothetical protein